MIPLLSWHPFAACPVVRHWPGGSLSGPSGHGDCTLSGSGPCLYPALERPAVHFPETLWMGKYVLFAILSLQL